MKKFLINISLILLIIFTYKNSCFAYKVNERILVGLKYGSSAVQSQNIKASGSGFTIRAQGKSNMPVANVSSNNLTVFPFNKNGIDSFMIVEQSGFGSLFDALKYCEIHNNELVPYYRNGVFYAVRYDIFNYSDALIALEKSKKTNVTSYIINPTSNRVKIYCNETNKTLLIFSEDDKEILGLCDRDGKTVSLGNESDHRDIIEFLRKDNSLTIMANLTMQHYLYSVVAEEIGPSAPLEAQKAQAVCARTYAQKNSGKHKSQGFDICASTHCQVYRGTRRERPLTIKAVDETKFQVATYKGQLIEAVYFSHSGGRTADVEDVWGNPFPYLKSVDDPYCTDSSWEYVIDYDKLTTKLKKYNLGKITNFEISKISDTGTVTEVIITGENGSKTLKRENIRIALNLNSQYFNFESNSVTRNAKTDSGIKNVTVKNALTSNGIVTFNDKILIKNGNNNVETISLKQNNVLKGKGIGHRVGFCQHGAMGFAEAGWDYVKILKHYYTGIDIEGI